jgi:hypothetical protein
MHVFEDKPDARQSADTTLETSRFRPKYRALTEGEKALHDAIKAKATELESLINQIEGKPHLPNDYKSLGLLKLEESVMWAIKELTA